MVAFPLNDATFVTSGGVSAATSNLTTVAASATVNTPGAWTQLVASNPSDATDNWIIFSGVAVSGATSQTILDIGVGAAGSEVIIASYVIGGATSNVRTLMAMPIYIAAGSRISARLQSDVASKNTTVSLVLKGGGIVPDEDAHTATMYGINRAASTGVALPAPTTANVLTAWTEIVASTTEPISNLMPTFGMPAGITNITAQILVDIGIGAVGAEAVLISQIPVRSSSLEEFSWPGLAYPCSIRTGSRLSARYQASATGAVNPSVALIGFN